MKAAIILGAGASAEYGYPLGPNLKTILYSQLKKQKGTLWELLIDAGNSESEVKQFATFLERSAYDTLDQFLGAHRNHPFIKRIGKQAIAAVIASFEKDVSLFPRTDLHWYKILLNFLRDHPHLAHRNHITFYTFNYDVSLEHFLHDALTTGGGSISPNVVNDFLINNVVHIHGSVGPLAWQNGDLSARVYEGKITAEALPTIANGILTPDDSSSLGSNERDSLFRADHVLIAGFGFHESNLRKIEFENLAKSTNRKIYATVSGLQKAKRDYLASFPNVVLHDLQISGFIAKFLDCLK